MRYARRRRVPIYLGAMGPQMLRLAGEIADGVLPLLFPPEHFATVQSLVAAGAASAGRALDAIDLAACIWVSISDDDAAAEAVLRDKIAYYGAGLSPLILDRLGVTKDEFGPIEHAMMTERDPAKARALVTDKMLRIGIVGTPSNLIVRLGNAGRDGCTTPQFRTTARPGPARSGRADRSVGHPAFPAFVTTILVVAGSPACVPVLRGRLESLLPPGEMRPGRVVCPRSVLLKVHRDVVRTTPCSATALYRIIASVVAGFKPATTTKSARAPLPAAPSPPSPARTRHHRPPRGRWGRDHGT